MSEARDAMRTGAIEIIRRLQSAGHSALFAGGCVRDQLRSIVPKDYDIATSARPDEILALYPRGDTIGAHFGVVLIRSKGHHFEIATFREDGDYSDGRRPDTVAFSTAEHDARRRDFTVNGMFYDPVSEQLIDYVGGEKDLAAGVIRAIGSAPDRFAEDYLRLLRAVRFAARLEFEIEPATWSALCRTAPKIHEITPERIREELDKIWLNTERVRGFDLLVASGLMAEILPEILDLQGCEQPPQWHPEGDVFVHTRLMLSLLPDDASLPLILSVLFHDIGKPATYEYDEAADRIRFNGHDALGAKMTETILKRLRYSNAVIDATVAGVAQHMKFKDVQKMKKSTLKRFMAREHFDDELALHRVDCLGSNGILTNYDFILTKRGEFESEPLIPAPFLTGRDLIDAGLRPGPGFKEILETAQDLQLEGTITSREEALAWFRETQNSPNDN